VWKAPEQLRLADSKGSHAMLEGSKQADVYTLALIMTEVNLKFENNRIKIT
jgi:hypothetical protein